MSDYILTSDGELYHYGVLGMKWGVRRYQRKDGSLTSAGKKKLSKEDRRMEKAAKKAAKKEHKDDYWKLLEANSTVDQTDNNVRATKRLMDETLKSNNPAKTQMANTLNMIAQREHAIAKADYVRIARGYIDKYGQERFMKGVVNSKNVQNGRGRVLNILSEDAAYADFVKSLYE